MTVEHSLLTSIHPGAHIDATSPSANANDLWVQRTGSAPYKLFLRNAGNSAWEAVSIDPTGELSVLDLAVTGLTGAANATRLVGRTASAAPASGTFNTGDVVTTTAGSIFVCTSGGTPGTWLNVGGAVSLTTASAYLGSDVTMTSAGTLYDGPSVSLAAGTWLVLGGIVRHTAGGNEHSTACLRDGSGTVISSTSHFQATTGQEVAQFLAGIVSPGSTTTYKISAVSDDASALIKAATVYQSQGNNASYILAVKIA